MNRVVGILAAAVVAIAASVQAQTPEVKYEPNWKSLDQRPMPQWFSDAKFGILIHWGLYSVPSWGAPKTYSEWYWKNMADKKPANPWWQFHKRVYGERFEYPDFAPLFKAELFDADQWADILYRSGAKYVVPTSKHHDGFCIWPSADADRTWGRPWNSVTAGPKRDLLGELTTAVRKKDGMKIGFYYSLYEWFNPLWLKDRARYVTEHMHPQFKDVVTRYRPSIILADGEWDLTAEQWKSPELLAWLFNESPCRDEVVIDDRWGKECRHKHGGYYTTEYGAGMKDASHPWEENRGMGYSFGYNRAEGLDDYKSARELVLVLCDLVSRGGNLNLDIGPAGDGTIPLVMQERLLAIGQWLKVNGEAIYGTRHAGRDCQWTAGQRPKQGYKQYQENYNLMDMVGQSPRGGKAVKQVFFTKKPEALYAITAGWPGKQLVLRNIKASAESIVTLLGHEGQLHYKVDGAHLVIDVPELTAEELPCLYAYAFKIGGAELLPDNE
jgi:alpha-L-fucosidase